MKEFRIIEEEPGCFYPQQRTIFWGLFRSEWGYWWEGPYERCYSNDLQSAKDFLEHQKRKNEFVPRVVA